MHKNWGLFNESWEDQTHKGQLYSCPVPNCTVFKTHNFILILLVRKLRFRQVNVPRGSKAHKRWSLDSTYVCLAPEKRWIRSGLKSLHPPPTQGTAYSSSPRKSAKWILWARNPQFCLGCPSLHSTSQPLSLLSTEGGQFSVSTASWALRPRFQSK